MHLTLIWEEKYTALRAIVRAIVVDESSVDDVLQEAFSRVLQTRRRFQDREEAFHYLRKTVLHTSIDAYRRSKRHSIRFQNYDPQEEAALHSPETEFHDPLTQLLHQEETETRNLLVNEVRTALEQLSAEQKEAIEIFFGERSPCKLKDICKEKGVPYSTLRSRMLQGIDRIRSHLRRRGVPGFRSRR